MSKNINISISLDPDFEEPEVIIKTNKKTQLTEKIVNAIESCLEEEYPRITLYRDDEALFVDQWDIIRAYTENRKLKVCTLSGTYECKFTLKELEERLRRCRFARISRFEIINLKWVTAFDLGLTGTIRVAFENGDETYVARRYVKSISEKLTLDRKGGELHE